MSEFAQDIDAWHDFFTLVGGASATLLGLLFVAVSLRPDIRTEAANGFQRTAVGHSFSSYLTVLLFSLYFLIPNQDSATLAWEILLTSLLPLVSLTRSYVRLRHSLDLTNDYRLWLFTVPGLCYLAGIGVAIAVFANDDTEIYWFVPIVALLMAVPTRNAWDLVLGSQDPSA